MQINSTEEFDFDHVLKKFYYVKLQIKIKQNIQIKQHNTVKESLYKS